jgi:co-chaperonin GroES (HSP10)
MTNPSGIRPSEFKVLIKPLEVEEKIGSIILPDQNKEREQFAQIQGHIIDVSPGAFTYLDQSEWRGQKPKIGDLVIYAKYAGANATGTDGVKYTLINDKDIAAVIEEKS